MDEQDEPPSLVEVHDAVTHVPAFTDVSSQLHDVNLVRVPITIVTGMRI